MLVSELETRVDRLRALYEQYFMGIEKTIPAVPHKDVERRIQVLRKEQIRNTAVRFRFQMIIQRYNTYQSHWQRICRQIEEGTYKRDRLRAERRQRAREEESVDVLLSSLPPPPAPDAMPQHEAPTKPAQIVHTLSLDDIGDLDAILNAPPSAKVPAAPAAPVAAKPGPPPLVKKPPPPLPRPAAPAARPPSPPAAPAAPAAAAKPQRPAWRKVEKAPAPPAAAPAPVAAPNHAPAPPRPAPKPAAPAAAKPSPVDLPDDRLRQIYSQYVQARRNQNESTAAITYDAMAKSLRESSAKLREKHGKTVDFEVAVKDGKTILKPVVKK